VARHSDHVGALVNAVINLHFQLTPGKYMRCATGGVPSSAQLHAISNSM
jgi:hypothetical protein